MSNQEINDLLMQAMDSEIKAKEFYLEAAEKAESKAGKKLFSELADFEQNHYNRVKKVIESLNKGIKIKCTEPCRDIQKTKSEIDGEFEPNKDEIISVINLAIDAEKSAQKRYTKIADIIDDEEGKKIFTDLASEERNHQRILEDEFYNISNKGTIIWE